MPDRNLLAHARDLARRGQAPAAARILLRLAEAGDAEAAADLGRLYDRGEGVEGDAAAWYAKAAKAGSARSALFHAMELDVGDDRDPAASARWLTVAREGLESAAAAGNAGAASVLSDLYRYGVGVPEDEATGIGILRRAAAGGDLEAMFDLGHWLWDRSERREDERREAIRLWRAAAEGGLIAAQYHLGATYATDHDMHIDYTESLRFYRMAADNGSVEALYNIGTMYLDGEGVVVDEAYGHALIVEAAERGDIGAMHYLAAAYRHGYHGLPVDTAEADYWQRRCDEE